MELIFTRQKKELDFNFKTTVIGSIFHFIYVLIKNRPELLTNILGKKDLFNCFMYITISMYFHAIKRIKIENIKSSEWLFFFFKHIFNKDATVFSQLYLYEHSEYKTIECDASLVYLTIIEPFIKILMVKSCVEEVSNVMITEEIREIQRLISSTIISSYEFKEIILDMCLELETNDNYKIKNICEESTISKILSFPNNQNIIIDEMNTGLSYLSSYLSKQIHLIKENNVLLNDESNLKIQNLNHIKMWISFFTINYLEKNDSFFDKIIDILTNILKEVLGFRKKLIEILGAGFFKIKVEDHQFTWNMISEQISITCILQAISILCYNSHQIKNNFNSNKDNISLIIECTNITDENQPFIKEASMLALRSLMGEKKIKL